MIQAVRRFAVESAEPAATSKTRVLHLARRITYGDVVDNVIRFLDRDRYQPVVCTFEDSPVAAEYARLEIPLESLHLYKRSSYVRGARALARIIRRQNIDVIHTHHFDEAIVGAMAARMTRRPLVLGRHYNDEVYLLGRGKRAAVLATERIVNSFASRVVVPTEAIRTLLHEKQGLDNDKIRVVPYGFDFDMPRYRTLTAQEIATARASIGFQDGFLVAAAGRHYWTKGFADLIHGFAKFAARYADARLAIASEGPDTERLKQLVAELGLNADANAPKVVFTGWWPGDVSRLLGAADAVVHPSYSEAFSLLVVETLSLGTPLIASSAGVSAEHFRDGETVITVPPRDPDAIADALVWVREHPMHVSVISRRAQRYVRSSLDIRSRARQYERCYAELTRPVA